MQGIEDSFSAKKKAGAVFVDLTAAAQPAELFGMPSHLQAITVVTCQVHGPHDHATSWQSHFHLYHR